MSEGEKEESRDGLGGGEFPFEVAAIAADRVTRVEIVRPDGAREITYYVDGVFQAGTVEYPADHPNARAIRTWPATDSTGDSAAERLESTP